MSDENTDRPAATSGVVHDKKNPFSSTLKRRVMLNKEGSAKETIHLEMCLAGSELEYLPGDSLAILPTNSPQVVEQIIETGGFNANDTLNLENGGSKPLADAFASDLDITRLTKTILKKYNTFAQSEKIEFMLAPENKVVLDDYLSGRQVIDMVADYPVPGLNPTDFCKILKRLLPRLYSIASSLKVHPEEVHMTIAVLRYSSHGRKREGVGSTFTADRVKVGETVPVFVHYNKIFKLPEAGDTPIIMVGPGTGIAPFRAFVEERVATGATGKSWLFFGDQHGATDYLYEEEWERHLTDGNITRINLAFSRDQDHKVYVQHRMLEQAAELYSWLSDGAKFYVCGDASRMANDVQEALITIAEKEGGKSRENALEWVKQLQADKRYLKDVY